MTEAITMEAATADVGRAGIALASRYRGYARLQMLSARPRGTFSWLVLVTRLRRRPACSGCSDPLASSARARHGRANRYLEKATLHSERLA